MTVLPSTEVRNKIGLLLNRLRETNEPMFISRRGKTEAVLLSMAQYKTMLHLLEDREDELDSALGQRIQEEREVYARGEDQDFNAFVAGLEP